MYTDQKRTNVLLNTYFSKCPHLEKCVFNCILVFVLVSKTVKFHLYSPMKPWCVTHCECCTAPLPKGSLVSSGQREGLVVSSITRLLITSVRGSGEEVVCYIKLIGSVFSDHDPSQAPLMWRRDWGFIMLQLTQLLLFVGETEILLLSVATHIESKAKRNPLLPAYHDTPRNLTQPDRHFSKTK